MLSARRWNSAQLHAQIALCSEKRGRFDDVRLEVAEPGLSSLPVAAAAGALNGDPSWKVKHPLGTGGEVAVPAAAAASAAVWGRAAMSAVLTVFIGSVMSLVSAVSAGSAMSLVFAVSAGAAMSLVFAVSAGAAMSLVFAAADVAAAACTDAGDVAATASTDAVMLLDSAADVAAAACLAGEASTGAAMALVSAAVDGGFHADTLAGAAAVDAVLPKRPAGGGVAGGFGFSLDLSTAGGSSISITIFLTGSEFSGTSEVELVAGLFFGSGAAGCFEGGGTTLGLCGGGTTLGLCGGSTIFHACGGASMVMEKN